MANALDAVLELRRQEQAQQEAQSQALTQAATIFMQARQLKQQEQLKKLELAQEQQKIDAAKNDPLRQILEKGKLYEARKNILEGGGGDILANQPPIDPISNPIGSAQQTVAKGNAEPLIPDKINSMGVPTSFLNPAAERKKNELELEKSRALAEEKSEIPTAQQKNDLQAVENQIANINNVKKLAEKIPAGRITGSLSGVVSSITGGEYQTATREYLKERPAMAVSLYRALTGDTRLSDADAKGRALPLLWHPTESSKIRDLSFERINKALEARKKLISEGRYKVDENGQFLTPIEDVLAEAEQPLKKKSLDVGTAKEFLKKAGGDKNKARELARQEGYEF